MQNIPPYYIVYLLHGFIPTCSAKLCILRILWCILIKNKKISVFDRVELLLNTPDTVVLMLSGFQLFYGTLKEESDENGSVVSKNAFSVDW